jgi:2,4-dienoyl-CoA reductase-like NADH-dependent reductase (Old Yellow Enzyme family)
MRACGCRNEPHAPAFPMSHVDTAPLFTPFTVNGMTLANRIIMPAMQRQWCEFGKPIPRLVEYYRERAAGGVPLIITESCAVDHPSATQEPSYAWMTPDTVDAWADCFDVVRDAGAQMFVQLWHEGAVRREGGDGPYASVPTLSPSGIRSPGRLQGRAATLVELAEIREGFARSAVLAKQAGASGVEVHACHGYFLDQFLWEGTNERDDGYGGPKLEDRLRFPAEVVTAVRDAVGPDYVISFRFSQWKQADYDAKIVKNPDELKLMLDTIAEAGADMFHASTRRFFTPEWPNSPLGLAGWTKSLTDRAVIACGSVGVDTDVMDNFLVREAQKTGEAGIGELMRRFNNREFDLISVGRANIGDPNWVTKIREGRYDDILGFTRQQIMPATRNADGVRMS